MKKFLMITITVCLLAGGVNAFAYGINSFTVYDAQDNIVHKITAKSEVNALYLLFQESLQIAADEALFTELPKDAQVLYRYVLSYNYGDDEQYFSFIVYKNYPLCRIPQLQEKEDIPKELTWKLFKYAYEIASKPAEVKKQLSYSAKNSYIRIYDDKSSLLLFITGEKILDIFDTLFGKDIAEIEIEERNLKSLFTAESVHNGREVLVHYSFMDDDKIMKLYLYKDTKEMNITTDTGVLKVNLSEEAYRILSNPKSFQAENSAKTAGTGKAILGISPHEKEIIVTAVTADGSPVQVEGCTVTELPSDEETILTATGTKVVLKGNITELDCSSNELTALDVRGLTALQTLYCDNNLLTSIDLHGLTALQTLYCDNNRLSSLDVRQLTALQWLKCYNNQLSVLHVQDLTSLRLLYCNDNRLTSLNLHGLSGLWFLHCDDNQLTALNVQGLTSLQVLNCDNNQLTTLNVQGLASLWFLRCHDNQLTSLDLKGVTALRELYCQNNKLTALDVRGLTGLDTLYCGSNRLTALDIHGLTALQKLYCNGNAIDSLDVRGLTALQALHCDNNYLTSLDVHVLTALKNLYCQNNKLTSLDVHGLTALQILRCGENQLTSLDVQGLPALQVLMCYDNRLTALNVPRLTALQELYCSSNAIASIDVRGLTGLHTLYCDNNRLTSLDV